jgi:Protein of unknown function, DUF488
MSPAQHREKNGGVATTVDTVHPRDDCARARQLPLPWPFAPDLVADHQESAATPSPIIFTIGHSDLDAESFLALLRDHGLETLIDVRSAPFSRFRPHFSRGALNASLDATGIRYIWAGSALGGRPDDPACYRDGIVRKGNVDYGVMSRQASYQEGVRQLLANAANGPVVVMCSEEDPRRCHRHHLLEPSLRELGATVLHIRRDGYLETIDPAQTTPAIAPITQLALGLSAQVNAQGIEA